MEINFSKIEEKILKFWQKNKIFEKSISQRKEKFVFYEGPPYANGKPGIHHLLARAFKDIILRYKTMRGFKVERRAGWDTHGLPTEIAAERVLKIKNKKDIEKIGIEKFIEECKKNIFLYKKEWEKFTERIGYWLDLKNAYITCTNDYIETLWWIIKQFYKKNFLYQSERIVPWCPRCQTSLSSHELAQGYKKIKEPAIFIKCQIPNAKSQIPTYLLVWTTTPWTLPGNVAIAVNPEFDYVKLKVKDEYLILARGRITACDIKGEIIEEFKGEKLIGLNYEPLYPFANKANLNLYKVIAGDFVSLEEGTGLVHIAPAFGEEDLAAFKSSRCGGQIPITVDEEGKMKTPAAPWDKMFVKDADSLILSNLKERNLLFKEELYEHDYPFCWRCETPLIYLLHSSWFVKTSKVKNQLIKNNQKINWIPDYLKFGRFGKWLEEVKDWNFSRERYWGTPLPIWQCEKCKNIEVIGGRNDLKKQRFSNNSYFLMRHGQAETNVKQIVSSNTKKYSLTVKGKKEAKETIKLLKKKSIDLILSSPIERAKQTAEIIGKILGIKPRYFNELSEIKFGIFENKPIKEYQDFFKDFKEKFKKAPKGGENRLTVKKRVYNFLKRIDKKYQNKKILIISHETPISLLESAVKGFFDEEFIKYKRKKRIKTGEVRELKFTLFPFNKNMELDFHRPYVDEIEFFCRKCSAKSKSKMKRVKSVCDVWFDSGSMPFAQIHYPFEGKALIDKKEFFPADFICEGIDQTRGWFYTLLAVSTLLGKESPYKNVISIGIVLDEKGEKMSKSKGNVVNPFEVAKKYGADATRWYFYTINQPAEPKLFSEKDVDIAFKKFILTLWNCYSFFNTYKGNLKRKAQSAKRKAQNLLDRWILSKLNELILKVTGFLDKYDVMGTARLIENFVINDLSLWYIRRSRKRFQTPQSKKELEMASETLHLIISNLIKLTAPFIPFLSEDIYQKIHNSRFIIHNSVHLEDWPKADKSLINKNLEEQMKRVREIVTLALAERAKFGIKVRQPLNELRIKNYELRKEKELLELIKEEVNVKEIIFDDKIEKGVKLDTRITPKLKEEGIVREIIRQIQEMRKALGLTPQNKVSVCYTSEPELERIILKNKEYILNQTRTINISKKEKKTPKIEKNIKVDGKNLFLGLI